MSRVARFQVVALVDSAGGPQRATIEIDRASGIFYVRPFRRRRRYALPLGTVATLAVRAIVFAELREKRAAQKKSKRNRRRSR